MVKEYNVDNIIEEYDKVVSILLNGNETPEAKATLDRTNILKTLILNRLNIEDFVPNEPVTYRITHIEPEFNIIVVRVKTGETSLLVGTVHIKV